MQQFFLGFGLAFLLSFVVNAIGDRLRNGHWFWQ